MYHWFCKYLQVNFFSGVVKCVRPTFGNKETLAPLKKSLKFLRGQVGQPATKIRQSMQISDSLGTPGYTAIVFYDLAPFNF